jgi:hypothetical protein
MRPSLIGRRLTLTANQQRCGKCGLVVLDDRDVGDLLGRRVQRLHNLPRLVHAPALLHNLGSNRTYNILLNSVLFNSTRPGIAP